MPRFIGKPALIVYDQALGWAAASRDGTQSCFGRLGRHVVAQPWDKLVEAELVRFVEVGNENIGLLGIRRETRAVDGQKSVRGGESSPLVAVNKRMVLREALPERGGFLDQIGVMPGLRPVESGFEQPGIPDTLGPAVAFDLIGMHGQHFGHGEVVRHSASFL